MKRRGLAIAAAGAVLLLAPGAQARPMGGFHGGTFHGGAFHGHPGHGPIGVHHGFGSHVFFFGFSPFVVPYYYPYPYYPYSYYPYPYYPYPPPPPYAYPSEAPESGGSAAEEAPPQNQENEAEEARQANYGLVQLRGVPNGAAVDLDGRFWLRAENLGDRWLALPRGAHTLVVRAEGAEPVERRVEVASGKTQVVRFATPARGPS